MDSSTQVSGFDFSAAMWVVCQDMASRLPELSHIDMAAVAVGFSQTRKNVRHGLQASLTPMRFQGGALEGVRRGRRYTTQRQYAADGREYLYLLNFYLPRFLNHPLEEKLTTITHELWHIGPEFDGDLRRHEGRCYAHGPSETEFDRVSVGLAQAWLALGPPHHVYAFLDHTFVELAAEHNGVYGKRIRTPRLIPVGRMTKQ